ncbi:MAG TPA: ATP-binding protein [Syntrophorhabdaceae bacterium]|nr:ATP-binding protein [Syntrophorhabdaceae bacterium]HOL06469.1 ATP-binding protein [Syntrophorhabdaceae bacterium]HOT43140.1 ATP-binding protein [Syntrophorhabdaceae bacterium]HPP42766.1 ATP-binding protein [Syntrophorhabdaceae bacterium]HQK47283.1 ATP-binding protein [Syntrophorhabdaceae bacterium]
MENHEELEKRIKDLEIELEDNKSLADTRRRLLEANIKELNEVYDALSNKFEELKERNERLKKIENELIRANRLSSLGELAGSIAHEIKNPLISIQGFAKRIQKTKDMDKIEKYSRLIDREAGRLYDVLSRLLDFSRMQGPRIEDVSVNEIVDDTVLFMEHHLTRFKNVELRVFKADGLPIIRADRLHIQQSLVNLIMNAAQAMPGGGTIEITTGMDDNNIFISVKDTGVGIKKENMDRIFEPFFTTKEKGEGTGLGLSLCKKLIEANKGRIEVESKEGEGSIFRILIPYKNN